MSDTELDKRDTELDKLLSLGKDVKKKTYMALVQKAASGEILTASEIASFNKLQQQLENKDNPEEEAQILPSRAAVLTYLTNRGYKTSYNGIKKHEGGGLLHPMKDGKRYLLSDVDAYAQCLPRRVDSNTAELDGLQRDKLEAEIKKARAQAEHWDARAGAARGALVPADWAERELAGRLRIFINEVQEYVRSEAITKVNKVKGDPAFVPDLIDFELEQFALILTRYAEPRDYTVPLAAVGIVDEEDG
jgi:hypothetical protein